MDRLAAAGLVSSYPSGRPIGGFRVGMLAIAAVLLATVAVGPRSLTANDAAEAPAEQPQTQRGNVGPEGITAADVSGRWTGPLTIPGAGEDLVALILTHDAETNTLTGGQLYAPMAGQFGTELAADAFTLEDRSLTVTLSLGGGMNLQLLLALSPPDSGTPTLAGTATVTGSRQQGPFRLTLRPEPRRVDWAEVVEWDGSIRIPPNNSELRLVVSLGQDPASATSDPLAAEWVGTIAIPVQSVEGLPLWSVEWTEEPVDPNDPSAGMQQRLTVEMPGRAGRAVLTGIISEDGLTWEGTFTSRGFSSPMSMTRAEGPAQTRLNRPQTPQGPFPYDVEDVRFVNPDGGHELAGTICTPAGEGPFPAVVLLTGSGPSDRDETILGHKPFFVLADAFARAGIASLRFDDRGVGESGGDHASATTADFATDGLAALRFLRERNKIAPDRVGMVGHSEGGLIATIAASAAPRDVAFATFLGGPGVSGGEIIVRQSQEIGRAQGGTEGQLARIKQYQTRCFEFARQNPEVDGDELAAAIHAIIEDVFADVPEAQREVEQPEAVARSLTEALQSTWYRFFITYDPQPDLERVRCPVLAVNGMLDLQVPWDQNLPAIWTALTRGGNHDVTLMPVEGLNHLFQPCETGAPDEYAQIETTFHEPTLARIIEWIQATPALTAE